MNKRRRYTVPVTEVFCIVTEGSLANMNPLSGTNITKTGEGDGRDPGSIGLDNGGDLGGITPSKRSLWDDDDDF